MIVFSYKKEERAKNTKDMDINIPKTIKCLVINVPTNLERLNGETF